MRNNGVADEEIKKQISPDNFLKYKKIVRDDIIKDFKVSMATDEIARLEGIEVPSYQVDEQMEAIKQDAAESKEEFDEAQIRVRVESTLMRQAVMDFLADNAQLDVQFVDEDGNDFDEELMAKLAEESLKREEELAAKAATASGDAPATPTTPEPPVVAAAAEPAVVEEAGETKEEENQQQEENEPAASTTSSDSRGTRNTDEMSLEDKAYYALLDSGALNNDK
jgi:hypothetical protein